MQPRGKLACVDTKGMEDPEGYSLGVECVEHHMTLNFLNHPVKHGCEVGNRRCRAREQLGEPNLISRQELLEAGIGVLTELVKHALMRTGLPVFQQPIRDFVSAFRCLGHRVDSETIAA